MKFRPTKSRDCGARRAGFTLAEVLAALVFMAVVIPTAVHGLRIASQAGTLGQRRAVAGRIAEQVINELVVTRQWQRGAPSGVIQDGALQYKWLMRTEPWNQQNMLRLLTVQVTFPVQGKDYDVRLCTVVDSSLQ